MITKLKADGEHDYLKQVPIHTLQASVDNLLTSYDRFFAKLSGFPKFKSKYESKQSFSFLSEKDDRINGTIRSYQLMQTITSLTGWLPDSDHQHHPPMYTFICNGVNHCIMINNDGTIKVDGQLVHSVDHYVSMKAQLENPQ